MTINRARPGRPPLVREPRPILPETPAARQEPEVSPVPDHISATAEEVHADIRPPIREETPHERLARRTAELRDVASTITDVSDEFHIDIETVPEGWTWEWKTEEVAGMSFASRMMEFRRTGWEEVRTRVRPDMMPLGTPGDEPIRRKGMILMERPKVITQEFEYRQKRDAQNQVRIKEAEVHGGEAYTDRDKGFENRSAGIKHGWERGIQLPSASQLEVPDY